MFVNVWGVKYYIDFVVDVIWYESKDGWIIYFGFCVVYFGEVFNVVSNSC